MRCDVMKRAQPAKPTEYEYAVVDCQFVRVSHAITQYISTEMGINYAALLLFC